MPCEKYKAALIGNAATGAELTPALREHVAACPSCAAEFAQRRSLFASIDSGVRQTMNAPLPPAMLHRFEARLAQEPQSQPSRSLKFSWLYTAAAFATAAAVILFAVSHQHVRKSNSQIATLDQNAKTISDHRPEIMTAILQPASPEEIRRDRELHRRRAAHTVSASKTPPRSEPEVLMPPDERVALEHYIANSGSGQELVAGLITPLRRRFDQPVKHIEIPDINTPGIVIAPIVEETRR